MNEWVVIPLVLWLALLLDRLLGEPARFHPLVGFGTLAGKVEHLLNRAPASSFSIVTGSLALVLVIAPAFCLMLYLQWTLSGWLYIAFSALTLYLCTGLQSLRVHALQIAGPLKRDDLTTARHFTGYMVSRDTTSLSKDEMIRATVESVLENGNDAVISGLFYFAAGGPAFALLHRLVNTLDAMWGYKNARYLYFGRAAAKADDLMALPGAWLTAAGYLIQKHPGKLFTNLAKSRKQSATYKSANGGLVMAAGANALGVTIGGGTPVYHGVSVPVPKLGRGSKPEPEHIRQSLTLVSKAAVIFCVVVSVFSAIFAAGALSF